MNLKRLKRKYFKSTEEIVSMFLGLVIVVVVVGLIFNFFQKKKGSITIPGSTDVKLSQNIDYEINSSDEYVVKKGDSLWKIAEVKYNDGYKWSQIAKENNLKNPGIIEVGQKLVLPKIVVKEVITNTNLVEKNNIEMVGNEYKVVKNDSLWKIAVRVYGDGYQWIKIWQANKIKITNPNGLEIGMNLTIPSLK